MKQAMMSVPPEIEAKRTSAFMSLGREFMATYLSMVSTVTMITIRFDISMFDHFKILDGKHINESSASASMLKPRL